MGTRALLHIKENGLKSKTMATIYRQYDGYPTGLGMDIYTILNNGKATLLNGFGDHQAPAYFNGMGCMGAYLIGELKDRTIGNVYLYPVNSKECGEEYVYTVYCKDNELMIQVIDIYKETNNVKEMPLKDFETYINTTLE